LLVAAGLYVAWYGWYELRVFRDPYTTDPIVDGAGRVQSAISAWLGDLGPGVFVIAFAVLLAAILSMAILVGLRRAQSE
jgi:cytochrome c-type biogenesis protein